MKRNLWITICAALVLAGTASCSKDSETDNLLNTQGASTKVAIREILEVELETAGTLAEKIGDQSETVQKLIISGPMNAADVNTFRNLPQLLAIDLKNATFCSDETTYTFSGQNYQLLDNIVSPYMFSGTQLSEIVLPVNITEIEEKAFWRLYGTDENPFESIVIPEGVTILREGAFTQCNNLIDVSLPSTLKEIENAVFSNCSKLTHINLDAVTHIGEQAFLGCSSLQTIELPETLESIGNSCFWRSGLTSIEIPARVTTLGTDVFRETPLRSAILPEGLTNIPIRSFYECSYLSSVQLPESLKSIGQDAFRNCDALINIIFPHGLNEIGGFAFGGCDGLESISLPASITNLATNCFWECTSLRTAEILSENLTSLPDHMFSNCRALRTVTLPESLREIDEYCFSNCEHLSDITLPERLEVIGRSAFYGCTSLESINFPESLTKIEGYAFQNSALSGDLILSEGLETIDIYAFAGCENLTSITIPKSVKEIGTCALGSYNLSAVFWNTSTSVPNMVTANYNSEHRNYNVLFYLADGATQVEDPDIRNIIVNGVADEIVLHSAANSTFRVPQEFRAIEVTYTRDFTFPTVPGQAAGWRSISLPFTVSQITGPAGQTLAPFNADVAGAKPFWLRRLTENGFENVTEIEANVPYIIAMPNNEAYGAEYNVNGTVTFSARDMQGIPFPATADADLVQDIGPEFALNCNFGYFPSTTPIYVLNETPYGNYAYAGSVFARNTRDIMPFEAYVANTMITASAPACFPVDGSTPSTRSTKVLGPVPSIDDM